MLSSQAHINHENYEFQIANSVFETLLKETQQFLQNIMLVPIEAIDTEAEESVMEIQLEAKEVAPEVAEVLVEVPKSPRMLRPELTPTKETAKDKKAKQPTIPVCVSPRRNPSKPTAQAKGKAINLEPKEEETKDIQMDDEDVGVDLEEVEAQGVDPITQLPEYVPPQKGKAKVSKDINESNTPLQTPLLSDEKFFEGPRLVQVPLLKLYD